MYTIFKFNTIRQCCVTYIPVPDSTFPDPIPLPRLLVEALAEGSPVYQLGLDELPDDIEDIRANAVVQLPLVFAWKTAEGEIKYLGAKLA